MSSKWILNIALLSVAFSSAQTQAANITWDKFVGGSAIAGGVFLAANLFAVVALDSKPDFKPEGSWSDLLKVGQLTSDPKAYGKNALNVLRYRWIGQLYKKGGLDLNKIDGGIVCENKCLPYGVVGNSVTVVMQAQKATGLVQTFLTLGGAMAGYYWLKDKFVKPAAKTTIQDEIAQADLELKRKQNALADVKLRAAKIDTKTLKPDTLI